MKIVIKENTWLNEVRSLGNQFKMEFGWGNGYVLIPEGHPCYGIDYNDIPVDVHGGLTFGQIIDVQLINNWSELDTEDLGKYMVGFDTCHYQDTLERWSQEAVLYETEFLRQRLLELSNN